MKLTRPTGKTILFPGLILAVAALGVLFFLQIRWMNNSLWAENMRFRREVLVSFNRLGRLLLEELELEDINSPDFPRNPDLWLEEYEYPNLIKDIHINDDEFFSGKDVSYSLGEGEILVEGGYDGQTVRLVLDGFIFYEEYLLNALVEYAGEYDFTLSYATEKREDLEARDREDKSFNGNNTFLSVLLPNHIDLRDKNKWENLLMPGPESFGRAGGLDFTDRRNDEIDPEKDISFFQLEVNNYEGLDPNQMEARMKRTNIGLIISLSLILAGSYFLLFRLYREEEQQRRVEQTFVASVSHELRTPIAVIKSASDNLSRGLVGDAERVQSYGSVIGGEADRLERMVESILYYSRLEGTGGSAKPLLKAEDPGDLTGKILNSLVLSYPEMVLERELDGAPQQVMLDRDAYRLILENLVTNAYVHGRKSAIRVRLESDYPTHWRLVVEDGGPGIPGKEQRRIFDPFVRGKRSIDDQVRGSGLGLYLIGTAVSGMGGRISLESPYEFPAGVKKRGCRFTLVFPTEKKEAP